MRWNRTELPSCPSCRKPLQPMAQVCRCGHIILRLRLQPKQRQLYELVCSRGANSPTRIGFGGSRGSAKSRGGRDIALAVALSNPGVLIYIVAQNLGNLEDNYIKKYENERPDIMQRFYCASPRPEINLPNGSTIAFRYADTAKDMTKLERGPEAFLIIVEQAEQFTGEQLIQIAKPARWPNAEAGAAKVVFLFNAGGAGMVYLQRVFYLKTYNAGERESDFAFIQAYGWDNYTWFTEECPGMTEEEFYELDGEIPPCPDGKYDDEWLSQVPESYRFKLYVTKTSEGRKYWSVPDSMRLGDLFGRFDVFAGQYFSGVWTEKKHVITSTQVDFISKYWWVPWMSMDWGFGEKHWCVTYWFVTGKLRASEARQYLQIPTEKPLDVIIIYRELILSHVPETEAAHAIVDQMDDPAERSAIRRWIAGSDTKQTHRGLQHTPRELIDKVGAGAGLPKIRDANDQPGSRVVNARMMYEMLRRTERLRFAASISQEAQEDTTPCLLISAECPGLIAAIPVLLSDAENGKPEDVQKMEQVADDCFDACKYGCAEYLSVKDEKPREVRLYDTIIQAKESTKRQSPMGQRANEVHNAAMAARKFLFEESARSRRGRRG